MADKPSEQPGEATRAIIALSGVNEHSAKTRRWLILGLSIGAVLVSVIGLDLAGVIKIPGIGLRGVVGLEPSVENTCGAVGSGAPQKSAAELERIRRKLLGGGDRVDAAPTPAVPAAGGSTAKARLAAELFADDPKADTQLELPNEREMVAPALPGGLSQKELAEVIAENSAAVSVCVGEAMRRGESPAGRMEVALTIAPQGHVSEAEVVTAKYQGSIVGRCITRRAANWKFPSFTGDAVTVVYPYVLGAGP